ncbi:helix-turn-helix domain-containing protein [Anatilimnocola floriformis]|uniref:helix-turn-helix domain-containing protein n=1 Tax=Anatilimnocola floriformis TaxID=2948575 RepID=UPI0020C36A58|nr:helix-turn-helix transcriptional regulator [Anatilimnocola floriformis]
MIRKAATKKPLKPAAEVRRLTAVREKFQSERPSLETLLASGEYDAMPQGEHFALMRAISELKEIRQHKKLSLANLAKRSGIDKAALSRLENGQNSNPTYSTLSAIARALGAELQIVVKGAK